MLVVNRQISIPLRELKFTFARSAGPGGQNVNKVNTKATLHWSLRTTGCLPEAVLERLKRKFPRRINNEEQFFVTSQRFRDQGRNVADCLEKLRQMVAAAAVAPKRRKATRPSRASIERRLQQKKAKSRKKQLRRGPAGDD